MTNTNLSHQSHTPAPVPALENLTETLMRLARERGQEKTFCPSEAARELGGSHPDEWGLLMMPVRKAAILLADEGRIVIYRKGRPVDPHDFKGVYRLGLPRAD
jgi:Protein of unknown function (DUF3253)